MYNLAVHMRISSIDVSDQDVISRSAAVRALAAKWLKEKSVASIISKAADIAACLVGDGIPSAALGTEVQTAVQKKSPSFLYEERPLEVGICAGVAMMTILNETQSSTGWSVANVFATSLWSALSFQSPLEAARRETLRSEVLNATENYSIKSAERARARADVPDPGDVKVTVSSELTTTHNFRNAVQATIDALRRNAELDREELDFLWWAQLGRSRALNKQLTVINEPTRIIAAGIEGAQLLHRLPCDVHREVVLRTLDQDPQLDLGEVVEQIGDDRLALAKMFTERPISEHPTVFPLLHAVMRGEAGGPGAAVKRPVSEWGSRALLEAGFSRQVERRPTKL